MDNSLVAAFALAAVMACSVLTARGDGLDWPAARQPAPDPMTPMIDPATIASWHALAAQVRANQPAWSSPLITTTGMLEQRFRLRSVGAARRQWRRHHGNRWRPRVGPDYQQQQRGADRRVALRHPQHTHRQGFVDRLRRLDVWAGEAAAGGEPREQWHYFVTVWLQVQAPTGIAPLTSHAWTYLPTLAVGKGWGDFDIQATVAAVLPDSNVAVLGDQIQTNVALQYHLLKIFWPEFEVNWTYWAGGQRGGLNQVFLTPGLVIGRFKLSNDIAFTMGLGYQVAVSPHYHATPITPAYNNGWVFTTRFNF